MTGEQQFGSRSDMTLDVLKGHKTPIDHNYTFCEKRVVIQPVPTCGQD